MSEKTNAISQKNQVIVSIAGGTGHETPSWLCVRHFAFHRQTRYAELNWALPTKAQ